MLRFPEQSLFFRVVNSTSDCWIWLQGWSHSLFLPFSAEEGSGKYKFKTILTKNVLSLLPSSAVGLIQCLLASVCISGLCVRHSSSLAFNSTVIVGQHCSMGVLVGCRSFLTAFMVRSTLGSVRPTLKIFPKKLVTMLQKLYLNILFVFFCRIHWLFKWGWGLECLPCHCSSLASSTLRPANLSLCWFCVSGSLVLSCAVGLWSICAVHQSVQILRLTPVVV